MELWGVGMVDEEVYNVLWQAFQNEKKTNELQHLPKNFYTDVIGFINNYNPNQIIGNTPNIKENAIRLVTGLYDKRKQKIMLYVAYGKQISQNQIKEEMEFYNNLVSLNKSSKINFTKNNDHSLKVLNDIPEIILPSNSKIGPLSKNQIISIRDADDKEFLITNSICIDVG